MQAATGSRGWWNPVGGRRTHLLALDGLGEGGLLGGVELGHVHGGRVLVLGWSGRGERRGGGRSRKTKVVTERYDAVPPVAHGTVRREPRKKHPAPSGGSAVTHEAGQRRHSPLQPTEATSTRKLAEHQAPSHEANAPRRRSDNTPYSKQHARRRVLGRQAREARHRERLRVPGRGDGAG